MEKQIQSQQVDTKETKQIRIDVGWHKILKVGAAQAGVSIKELVETCLSKDYQRIKDSYGLDE